MNELVQLLTEKTGIPKEKAAIAVELVLHYLRDRSPPAISSQLDHLLQGDIQDPERRGGWNS